MHIYKLRLLSDLNDDFVRDIEIQGTQTFDDLHKIISECINLNGKELASFHICDQKWNKLKEITLLDMLNSEESDEGNKLFEETYTMKDVYIKDFISEPHQRLVYEYDFLNMNTFFIELQSVFKQKNDNSYPKCTLSKGDLVREPDTEEIEETDEELTEQLLKDFDELLSDTYDYRADSDESFI